MSTHASRAMTTMPYIADFGGNIAFSGIRVSTFGSVRIRHSRAAQPANMSAPRPAAEATPERFTVKENHPRVLATSEKNAMASNNKVWMMPSVIRMTEVLVKNRMYLVRSFEIRSSMDILPPHTDSNRSFMSMLSRASAKLMP